MKRLFYLLICCLTVACTSFDKGDSYEVLSIDVRVVYPEGYEGYLREGVTVTLRDQNSSNRYTAVTDAEGYVQFHVTNGIYRVSVLDKPDRTVVFNGAIQGIRLFGKGVQLEVELKFAMPGTIIIKEAYFGGCPALPAEGSYYRDKYIILHNNDTQTQYLDKICVGMVDPYNSYGGSGNYWLVNGEYRAYASVPDCVWQLPGSGTDFPLAPGEDAVIAMNGAVDHTQTYPLSVNLNNSAYYVFYDTDAYNQTNSVLYHPTPGDQILPSHHFKVIKKTGTRTSQTSSVSQTSPAMIVYRAPEHVDGVPFDFEAYLADDQQSVTGHGSLSYTMIPWDWIIDGVEVFYAGGGSNQKRLRTDIDADAVEFTSSSLGRTVHRHLDEEATISAGYEIYVDTNNSANDFYERSTQSLRE